MYPVESTEGSIRTDCVRNIGKKHRFFSVLCYRFIRDKNKTWRQSDVKDGRAKGTKEERRKFQQDIYFHLCRTSTRHATEIIMINERDNKVRSIFSLSFFFRGAFKISIISNISESRICLKSTSNGIGIFISIYFWYFVPSWI